MSRRKITCFFFFEINFLYPLPPLCSMYLALSKFLATRYATGSSEQHLTPKQRERKCSRLSCVFSVSHKISRSTLVSRHPENAHACVRFCVRTLSCCTHKRGRRGTSGGGHNSFYSDDGFDICVLEETQTHYKNHVVF